MQINTERLNRERLESVARALPGGELVMGSSEYLANNGVSYALFNHGQCCCIGGVYTTSYPVGVGTAWLMVDPSVIKMMPQFTIKFCKAVLGHAWTALKLHRIEAYVETHQADNRRWAELCGFAQESIMRKYTSEAKDVTKFAII